MVETPNDPTYPKAIKPMLYAYDEYQTYDLIKAEKIAGRVKRLSNFASIFGFNLPEAMLIERFTPFDYEWAERYSFHFYNFIKDFSGTDYYDRYGIDDPEQMVSYPFAREYKVTKYPTITIPSGEGMVIMTWLERDGEDTGGFIKADAYFIKRKRVYYQADTDYTVKLPLESLLPCSVVVSGQDEKAIEKVREEFNRLSKGYLYENLEELLSKIKPILLNGFPNLYRTPNAINVTWGIDYSYGKGYRTVIGYDRGNPNYPYFSFFQFESVVEATSMSPPFPDTYKPSWTQKPDWYNGAGLIYANNNYWANSQMYEDIKPREPFFQILETGQNTKLSASFLKQARGTGIGNTQINLETLPDAPYPSFRNVWRQEISAEIYHPGLIKLVYKKRGISVNILAQGGENTYNFYAYNYFVNLDIFEEQNATINTSSKLNFLSTYTFEYIYHPETGWLTKIYYSPPMSGEGKINLSVNANYYGSAEEVPADNLINDAIFYEVCKQYYLVDSL